MSKLSLKRILFIFILPLTLLFSCYNKNGTDKVDLKIDYEKYQLSNGLDVVLHQDASDPVVAIAILFHVGSNREKPGRTGFAHFFEHMLFQKSENVPPGFFFKRINELGGTFNGGTWQDGTIYYEVVPKDALEKMLWMESDRMGFLINAVTKASLENEKPVVKNEKRQRNDNQPYGHTNYVISKALYPENHPYNWQVIGSLEDLQNATIEDVKEFYNKWYGPDNATIVIAGDFDKEETKAMVEKYFAEIPSKGEVKKISPRPAKLNEIKKLYHEDNFATLPELRMVYPTVENFHEDAYALDILADLLYNGKRAPFYKVLVEEKKLAPQPTANHSTSELAGTFTVRVRGYENTDLDEVEKGINESFSRFENKGFTDKDLNRVKNSLETDFYNNISSLFGKAWQLASYNEYAGSPNYISEDIKKTLAVTREDVMRVYNKYIKDKPFVLTSFVPKDKKELMVDGSEKADVVEEEITENTQKAYVENEKDVNLKKTPSKIDRSKEPELGETPKLNPPSIWTAKTSNGIDVYGIKYSELPLVEFSLQLLGGHLLDNPEKVGVANLMTDIMMEGTANKTPEELEDAIGQLGATIRMSTSNEYITLEANCLARNYDEVLALAEEILLQPRWDAKEFERIKQSTIAQIQQREANPNVIAASVFNKLIYGDDHIFSKPIMGSVESVTSITLEDLKSFYENYFSPSVASFHIVGDIEKEKAMNSIKGFEEKWKGQSFDIPIFAVSSPENTPALYFVDVPGAKQSTIRIGRIAPSRNSKDYFAATVANNRLGEGSSGKLFQVLREEKGYTYGAYSYLVGRRNTGAFVATSGVRSNVTLESVETFKELLENYGKEYTDEDLNITRNSIVKSNTRRFETIGSLIGMLETISTYQLPLDYIKKEENEVMNMNLSQVKSLIDKYIDPNNMIYVVVGDAKTQLEKLEKAGFKPVLVDKQGNATEAI